MFPDKVVIALWGLGVAVGLLIVFVLLLSRQLRLLGQRVAAYRDNKESAGKIDEALLHEQASAKVEQIRADLETLRNRQTEFEHVNRPQVAPAWPVEHSSINLNRKGQILRLFGKGKSSAEIAETLRISQGEVDLLIKVHDLSR